MPVATIDVGLLFEVVWASALASAVVAMVYGAAAVVAFVAFGALVVYAVHIMLSKG